MRALFSSEITIDVNTVGLDDTLVPDVPRNRRTNLVESERSGLVHLQPRQLHWFSPLPDPGRALLNPYTSVYDRAQPNTLHITVVFLRNTWLSITIVILRVVCGRSCLYTIHY